MKLRFNSHFSNINRTGILRLPNEPSSRKSLRKSLYDIS